MVIRSVGDWVITEEIGMPTTLQSLRTLLRHARSVKTSQGHGPWIQYILREFRRGQAEKDVEAARRSRNAAADIAALFDAADEQQMRVPF